MAKKNQRKNDNNISLISVIGKVKNISDREYDGRVYDHILTIFNKLSTKEKRVLLRGLINIVFIVEDKVVLNSTDLDHLRTINNSSSVSNNHDTNTTNDDKNTDYLLSKIEELNEVKKTSNHVINTELDNLKKLFLKVSSILAIGIIVLIIVIITEFNPDVYTDISRTLVSIFKYIILF